MKNSKSSWDRLNLFLNTNEKSIRLSIFYITLIFVSFMIWLIISDQLMILHLDEIGQERLSFYLINITFLLILIILSVSLIRRFIDILYKMKDINSLLSSVADSSNEIVIFAVDKDYRLTYFNKMCYKSISEVWNKQININDSLMDIFDYEDDRIKSKKSLDKAFNGETFKIIEEFTGPQAELTHWQNYYAPLLDKDQNIVGASCFAINITSLVEAEQQSRLLSNTDELTGLYNRRYFNQAKLDLDTPENYPLSIIIADVNGLKFTNDIFGHVEGDTLIKHLTTILKNRLKKPNVIARLGGDEFGILLPNTSSNKLKEIIMDLERHITKVKTERLILSVSFGYATKSHSEQHLEQLLVKADNLMYHNKLLDRQNFEASLSRSLYDYFYSNPVELRHAEMTTHYCIAIAKAMSLSDDDINVLSLAAFLHDIGKITFNYQLLARNIVHEQNTYESIIQHCEVGYKILNFFERYQVIADYVHYHHEQVDGNGLPIGLVDDDIPLFSKIIAVANTYDSFTSPNIFESNLTQPEAIAKLKSLKDIELDPTIVDIFIQTLN